MTDHLDETQGPALRWILVLALVSIIVGGTVDLILDQPTTWLSFHVIFEVLMLAGALLMATTLWLGWYRTERSMQALAQRLAEGTRERDAWRSSAQRALEGLGRAIDEQFSAWSLTPAEREVALLLLKGYSHKHIARVTHRSERTARQHAAAVYEKAGLAGRAELAAFFLEDLMLPDQGREVLHPDTEPAAGSPSN